MSQALVQPDARRDLAHLRAPRSTTAQAQRQRDVLSDRERRHQIEGLKDEPDPRAPQDGPPPLAELRQVGVPERDGAGGGPVKSRRMFRNVLLPDPDGP